MDWEDANKVQEGVYSIPKNWLNIEYYDALNVLYRVENALRMYVYVILKKHYKAKWDKQCIKVEENENGTIEAISKKRRSQARAFGYIGFSATCPLAYLTSGELGRVITSDAYWSLFKEGFVTNKEIVKLKLEEMSSIRNEMAHFRAIKSDDVAVIRTNAKQLLTKIEKALLSMLNTSNTVPTNTEEEWYRELKAIRNEYCYLEFMESTDGQWINIIVKYGNALVQSNSYGEANNYRVLTVNVPAILSEYEKLRENTIYMSERRPFSVLTEEDKKQNQEPFFLKEMGMVFAVENVRTEYKTISEELTALVAKIKEESDLIKRDNLAAGKIVNLVWANATLREGDKMAMIDTRAMLSPERETDPPEWWGTPPWVGGDFISDTKKFPWIPCEISGGNRSSSGTRR